MDFKALESVPGKLPPLTRKGNIDDFSPRGRLRGAAFRIERSALMCVLRPHTPSTWVFSLALWLQGKGLDDL